MPACGDGAVRKHVGVGSRRTGVALAACVMAAGMLAACGSSSTSGPTTVAPSGKVLLVGTFHGHTGQYTTIQSAVNAAKPGDWILVAPGDYHETADSTQPTDPAHGDNAGVMISTPDIHLRGMDRSTVVVDGTKAGARRVQQQPVRTRPTARWVRTARPSVATASWCGRPTACPSTTSPPATSSAGTGDSGNEIWWNGGADSGTIGLHGYSGSYLTATSTYYGAENTAAQYGIFSSDSAGPATWNQTYASNFNDSGEYVGACQQVCDVTIDHAWVEYDALGYSGTNSGGAIVVENSQFDNNKDGFDTNTQIAGDPPAPQNGACPDGGTSPITHTHSCWVFIHNYVHDNNNPNVPEAGTAGQGPVGTGMTLSGGRNDTVMDNTVHRQRGLGLPDDPVPGLEHTGVQPVLLGHRRRGERAPSAASTTRWATR